MKPGKTGPTMRLWTLHPKYLDAKGLVALWREALLAQKVLRGLTRGYVAHPQLQRFREQADPVATIGTYLLGVFEEAVTRGYHFDRSKILITDGNVSIRETRGQLRYEWEHLRAKLARRDPAWLELIEGVVRPQAHPLFQIVPGGVQEWERTK